MWPYSWTHVGTPSHLGHMDRVAATMPSQAHAGAAQEAPNIGQWEGQDAFLVRPSSCTVKGGIPSSGRYLPTLPTSPVAGRGTPLIGRVSGSRLSRAWVVFEPPPPPASERVGPGIGIRVATECLLSRDALTPVQS